MFTVVLCLLVSAPVWTSLGFLAGASFSYLTKKELFSAWESLARESKTLLARYDADARRIGECDLAALRQALRLLEDLDALPKTSRRGIGARWRGKGTMA